MQETYRIWTGEWSEFPTTALVVKADTLQRWTRVLESLEAITTADTRPPRLFHRAIAAHYNKQWGTSITGNQVRCVLDRIIRKVRKWQEDESWAATINVEPDVTADDVANKFLQWVRYTKQVEATDQLNTDERVVIVGADYHGQPHPDLVTAMLKESTTEDVDVLFLHVGDLYDVFASVPAMRALKNPELGTRIVQQETANLTGFFHILTSKVPHARHRVLWGNHDMLRKILGDNAYPVMKVLSVWLGDIDPLTHIINQFPQVEAGGWNIPYVEPNGRVHEDFKFNRYAHLAGDVLVSHLGRNTGKDAHRQLWQWVLEKQRVCNLQHLRVALQAHAHRVVLEDVQGGHVTIGCIGYGGQVNTLGYQYGYTNWRSDLAPGFVVLRQERATGGAWRTIRGSVRHIRF